MKNYTIRIVLFFLLISVASIASDRHQYIRSQSSTHSRLNTTFTPFYSEAFAGGLPAGWSSIDSAGNGVQWHYTTTGAYNGIDSLSENGTTAADGYMIYDSDSAGGSVGGENSDLISDTIDCSGHPNVHLNFNEFLTYYNDTATVWVSNDGTTWTEFHNSSAGLSQYSSTPNPNNVDIDISSVAANMSTVFLRFNYRANYSFFWMIDDIALYEAPAIEASIVNISTPATSCIILSSGESVTVNIFNSGGAAINGGLSATYIVDGGSPVTESISTPIPSGDTLEYSFSATADFSALGTHTITAYIALAGDTIGTNDTISTVIYNGPHPVNTSTNYTNGFESADDLIGFTTEDNNSDSVTWQRTTLFPYSGIYCMTLASVTANDWLFTNCLDLDGSIVYKITYYYRTTSTAAQARYEVKLGQGQSSGSMPIELSPMTLISNIFYTTASHQFNPPVSGTYYIGFHVVNGDSAVTGFYLDNISIVADSGVGIADVDQATLSFFPNPSSGVVFLNSKKNSKTGYRIDVMNPVGKIISSEKSSELNNFVVDLKDHPSGIYFIRVVSDDGITERKISIVH